MSAWEQPSRWGIRKGANSDDLDDPKGAWGGGRLDDVLRLNVPDSTVILAAAPFSGVWQMDTLGGAARSLSMTWDQPNVSSLAQGLRTQLHVYAAGESLYETDTTKAQPLDNWIKIGGHINSPLDPAPGFIRDLVAVDVAGAQRLVLACDNGIFWAQIPPPGGTYTFQSSDFPNLPFSSITEGRDGGIVATMSGDGLPGGNNGIWLGIWKRVTFINLRPVQSTLPTVFSIGGRVFDPTQMLRMSIDSYAAATATTAPHQIMYAIADYKPVAPNTDTIYCVLYSDSFGESWTATNSSIINDPQNRPLFGPPGKNPVAGNNGFYNQCVSVSQSRPGLAVVGWRDGIFFTTESGQEWFEVINDSLHLHGDFHSVLIDPLDSMQNTIYACTDGGLTVVDITNFATGNISLSSMSNKRIPNLMASQIALSPTLDGLSAVSLQDNGQETLLGVPSDQDPFRTGQSEDLDNDGRAVAFIQNGRRLWCTNTANNVHDTTWNPTTKQFQPFGGSIIQVDVPNPQNFAGNAGITILNTGPPPTNKPNYLITLQKEAQPLEAVVQSAFQNSASENMVAVAGVTGTVYGLFMSTGGSTPETNPAHWTPLGQIPLQTGENIWAIGSFDGTVVFAGTDQGHIFALTPGSSATRQIILDVSPATSTFPGPGIIKFAFASPKLGFAITFSPSLFIMEPGIENAVTWTLLPNPSDLASLGNAYIGLAVNPLTNPPTVFVASDAGIWASGSAPMSWSPLSGVLEGLPQVPHCTDLAFATETTGAQFLYLATYGWSIWRRLLIPNTHQDVTISGSMGITVTHASDISITPALPTRVLSLDFLDPVQTYHVVNVCDVIVASLDIECRLQPGGNVRCVMLIRVDNQSAGSTRTWSEDIVLSVGGTKYQAPELAFDGATVDHDITVTN